MKTVREETLDVMRLRGLTTLFSNPGSTEVPFLVDLPDDFDFILALHEGSVVGMATGYALATGRCAFALLHTTAGLGNAVGAIATARVNRAPLVVMVGQQDRRHLALEPFLTGQLDGLAGNYPLEILSPVRAADVPSAVSRAALRAEQGSGPVLVIVPMGDWDEPMEPHAAAAAGRVVLAPPGLPAAAAEVAAMLAAAHNPAILAGAGNDTEAGWAALTELAETLQAPVWIEPFGARAGFPQTHPLYQGQLPADRPRVRAALSGHDVLLVAGTAAIRQYPYAEGPLVPEQTRIVVLTADAAEANRSPADLALVGDPAVLVAGISRLLAEQMPPARPAAAAAAAAPAAAFRLDPPAEGEALRAAHVFELLARYLPRDAVLVEEAPSSRPALQAMVPAQAPLGFVSAAMGGLGFALPAAIGLKMGLPGRTVVAVVGDGSSLYAIQSLWTAAERGVPVVFIVLANGSYAVMDRLADKRGGKAPWPAFPQISVATLAEGLGVPARRVTEFSALEAELAVLAGPATTNGAPLLLEVSVAAEVVFAP
ncbi:thiamine pyrophosphate-binding protein [Arthrobacter sp. zg-Y1219]|uniref:thiamine pyrophosphate-dependent enzyme n=1 Tax=Arthrobacter sp. zg-Y1219 TaxID=3049067 RepID=UPI0024C457AE|nr:thiamine pyrophosphate-dependent enzyme [Arthrobacter sp. zg-Y1219]MDK1359389.1 thiamine pyrophosphate-binding protein [Arthrobacter sp. zg-Y1219]